LTQYTFKVRDGIQFHNGDNLTSADIKYTFDRILDPETASLLLGQIDYIENITTPDANTVVFNLDGANAFMPSNLTDYHARILPVGTGDKVTSSEVGSGAYILGDHNPTERTVMERNPNYWRENRPFADQMLFFYMPEQVTRVEAIKSGAIDI
jgi:peptide/nickel transport system substrate-binding protein